MNRLDYDNYYAAYWIFLSVNWYRMVNMIIISSSAYAMMNSIKCVFYRDRSLTNSDENK